MSESWIEEWIGKAEQDYLAASTLDARATPGAVCFHCQQCVEKYLKAALVRQGETPRRAHDLLVLNGMAAQQDDRFGALEEQMESLNPYSVLGRYPGYDPSPEDAKEALTVASSLREEIRRLLAIR